MYDLQSSLNVQCTWGSGLNLLEPLKEEVEIKPHFSRTAGFWYNGTEKISWNALRQATRPSRMQTMRHSFPPTEWDREDILECSPASNQAFQDADNEAFFPPTEFPPGPASALQGLVLEPLQAGPGGCGVSLVHHAVVKERGVIVSVWAEVLQVQTPTQEMEPEKDYLSPGKLPRMRVKELPKLQSYSPTNVDEMVTSSAESNSHIKSNVSGIFIGSPRASNSSRIKLKPIEAQKSPRASLEILAECETTSYSLPDEKVSDSRRQSLQDLQVQDVNRWTWGQRHVVDLNSEQLHIVSPVAAPQPRRFSVSPRNKRLGVSPLPRTPPGSKFTPQPPPKIDEVNEEGRQESSRSSPRSPQDPGNEAGYVNGHWDRCWYKA
eukprot:CAMPEP_0184326168 /NCGR_PEP_ID=MMETSP1049-20130417/142420_1 /TAXON_ID=77928 /ORGANISM="Proteomonas sulcata, Strain CCMP704" /LENGTH=377 /DNA_ID=CAMNT_0026648345 /DNA_START=267 /DNA_END=1402 /DNA_ORIENTATION=-